MLSVLSYLDRIHYSGSTAPNTDTLRGLHHAHLLTVPFENLSIGRGEKIVLDENALLRKIVERRRGGFCYELNGAFAALLRELGFAVTLLSARVAREYGGEGPDFDHLALRVDLEEPWLADVGFGDSFLEPLRLESRMEQLDPAGSFRLTEKEDRFELERLTVDKGWKRQFSFTLAPRGLQDFGGMCHYHQTSPESSFTQNRICSRATPDGRITLSGLKLIVDQNGNRNERMLESEEEWLSILRKDFGIVL